MPHQHLADNKGNPIILGGEIGRGGEGIVYNIQNSPKLAAKIYNQVPDQQKSAKIVAMVGLGTERLINLTAWPLATIHNSKGQLVGFTMPKLVGYRPIFELYNPKVRLQEFPQADWRFLIHAAQNCARAFAVIHETGHVVGDVNHGNLFVAPYATVRFIDTDSFQITTNSNRWFCEVGVSTHQPPEMQGHTSYKGIVRTPNHDNFGLAVLIFQLLCMARHSFSGRYSGQGEMPIEKAISEYRFAYSAHTNLTQMSPPPACLPMSALTPQIRSFFEEAFSIKGTQKEGRYTAVEWVSALQNLALQLEECPLNAGHHHLQNLTICPWCDIEIKSKSKLFNVVAKTIRTNCNISEIWAQVLKMKDPDVWPPIPSLKDVKVMPSWKAILLRKPCRRFLACCLAIALTIPFLAHSLLMFVGIFPVMVIVSLTLLGVIVDSVETDFFDIRKSWNELSYQYNYSSFKETRLKLEGLMRQYDVFQSTHEQSAKEYLDNHYKMQLAHYLKTSLLEFVAADVFAPKRISILRRFGIVTAADIQEDRLKAISGISPTFAERLVEWRLQHERKFCFDASKVPFQREVDPVKASQRLRLEGDIVAGAMRLAEFHKVALERRFQYLEKVERFLHVNGRVIADAKMLGLLSQ